MSKRFIDISRGVIKVFGNDSSEFLQGIITNNIYNTSYDSFIYSLFPYPTGQDHSRSLYTKDRGWIFLDCPIDKIEIIIKNFLFIN